MATLHLQLVMHLSSGHRLQHIPERRDNVASVSAALEQHGMADGLGLKRVPMHASQCTEVRCLPPQTPKRQVRKAGVTGNLSRAHLASTSSAAACVTGTPTAVGPAPTCIRYTHHIMNTTKMGECQQRMFESRHTAVVHTDTM